MIVYWAWMAELQELCYSFTEWRWPSTYERIRPTADCLVDLHSGSNNNWPRFCILEFWTYTQKNFGTQKSIFVCCTEDSYIFVSRNYLFECSPCGTRPDSTVTWNYLFVTAPIASFCGGGGEGFRFWNMEYCQLLSHIKTIEMKLKGLWCMIADKKEIEKIILKQLKSKPRAGIALRPSCYN